MNYPYKYIVKIYDTADYSEASSTFAYIDFAEAEAHYNEAVELGSRVFMYRILKSDNLDM